MESYAAGCMYPLLKAMLIKFMNVTDGGVERSWAKIEAFFKEVDETLGDAPLGTQYLAGKTFSAADVSFCAHAGIILVPRENAFLRPYIDIEALPPVFQARHRQLVASKAGQFVLYCWKHHYPSKDE
ncbi:Aste57867_14900 [Aphanomyces stellatus]|nr:hypothetical protein As57867_014844 [Aphanomyces stellatus]VFT91716.1 Aste57867_14900 [Aphanomyces stellatus]